MTGMGVYNMMRVMFFDNAMNYLVIMRLIVLLVDVKMY
jgi:hypothetical protein